MNAESRIPMLSGRRCSRSCPVAAATTKITVKTMSGGPGWIGTTLRSRKPMKTAVS
jgi:hypothetical protein